MFSMYELGQDEVAVELDFNKQESDPWWNFKPLTYLDLSSNVIQELPAQISVFEDLTTLNVSVKLKLQQNCIYLIIFSCKITH